VSYAISRDDDFTCEFIGKQHGGVSFRLCIDTDDPEKFTRFRLVLECAEKILRMPTWQKQREQEQDVTFAYEWDDAQ
jgi:hypothetical protein